MSKTEFYLSECAAAAMKSPMQYTLGAVLVKGGKVISRGHNHHRTHYDGADVRTRGHRKPVSMHAEMHTIYTLTGMSPSFRAQGERQQLVQGPDERNRQREGMFKGAAPLVGREGHPKPCGAEDAW